VICIPSLRPDPNIRSNTDERQPLLDDENGRGRSRSIWGKKAMWVTLAAIASLCLLGFIVVSGVVLSAFILSDVAEATGEVESLS
jgi:hypothetical protein